jgi:hypothetical protein
MLLRQLGEDVPQAVDGAAASVGVGPELTDRPDEPQCTVGDDEERAPEAPRGEPVPEIEPVLDALALAEADVEQDPFARRRVTPGDEDALLRALRAGRQVDRIEHQAQERHGGEALGPEGPVAVAQFAADVGDGAPGEMPEPSLGCERLDVAGREPPHVRADDERL